MAGLRQRDLTRYADTVIVGGGSAGAARAGVFAERSEQSVVLLEAGPDYGAFDAGAWPADLTDARTTPASDDWAMTAVLCIRTAW